jgi:hypothetical protein
MMDSPEPPRAFGDFWTSVYLAIDDGGMRQWRPDFARNYFRNNFVRHVGAAKHGSSYP